MENKKNLIMGKDDVLYFLHIPKTAGTSLIFSLENYFDVNELLPSQMWRQLLLNMPENFSNYKFVKGHFGFDFGSILPKDPKYITVLRDPEQVIISMYKMLQRHPNSAKLYSISKDDSLSELLSRPAIHEQINPQCKWLSADLDVITNTRDYPVEQLDEYVAEHQIQFKQEDISDDELLEKAKLRLSECSFFGIVEKYEESLFLLHYNFGWFPIRDETKLNVDSSGIKKSEELTEKAKTNLELRTQIDKKLYRYAINLFEERYSQMVKDLKERYFEPKYEKMQENDAIFDMLQKYYSDHYKEWHTEVSSLEYDFGQSLDGYGWHQREIHPDTNTIFRWTGPENKSFIDFPLKKEAELKISFRVLMALIPTVTSNLKVSVNDNLIDIKKIDNKGVGEIFEGKILPEFLDTTQNYTRISFEVENTFPSQYPQDSRKLGVALDWIQIQQVSEKNKIQKIEPDKIRKYSNIQPDDINKATIQLSNESRNCKTIEDFVDLAYSFESGKIQIFPLQIKNELIALLKILEDEKPKVLLEIGTANGGSLFLFSKIADDNADLISIDLPQGNFGGEYFPEEKTPFYKSFKKTHQQMKIIRKDSHDIKTIEELKSAIGEKKIDFLVIDGDHTYDGVKSDFENFSNFVKDGGLIVFHDICKGYDSQVQVPKFWEEIKKNNLAIELIDNDGTYHYGIGIILKGDRKNNLEKFVRLQKIVLDFYNLKTTLENKEFFTPFEPKVGKKISVIQNLIDQKVLEKEKEIDAKNEELVEMRAGIDAKNEELVEMRAGIDSKNEELVEQKSKLDEVNTELEYFQNSKIISTVQNSLENWNNFVNLFFRAKEAVKIIQTEDSFPKKTKSLAKLAKYYFKFQKEKKLDRVYHELEYQQKDFEDFYYKLKNEDLELFHNLFSQKPKNFLLSNKLETNLDFSQKKGMSQVGFNVISVENPNSLWTTGKATFFIPTKKDKINTLILKLASVPSVKVSIGINSSVLRKISIPELTTKEIKIPIENNLIENDVSEIFISTDKYWKPNVLSGERAEMIFGVRVNSIEVVYS